MSKQSFTPGPWTTDLTDNIYEEGQPVWGVDGPDYSICMVDGPDDAPNEANARLIAAAPDLLAALDNLIEYGGHVRGCEGSPLGCKQSCIRARAAISKATGGQQ